MNCSWFSLEPAGDGGTLQDLVRFGRPIRFFVADNILAGPNPWVATDQCWSDDEHNGKVVELSGQPSLW